MKTLAAAPFVLVAEGFNVKTGPGQPLRQRAAQARLQGHATTTSARTRKGSGGLWQQMGYQGLDPDGITKAIRALAAA